MQNNSTKDNWIKALWDLLPYFPEGTDSVKLESFISQVEKDAIEKTKQELMGRKDVVINGVTYNDPPYMDDIAIQEHNRVVDVVESVFIHGKLTPNQSFDLPEGQMTMVDAVDKIIEMLGLSEKRGIEKTNKRWREKLNRRKQEWLKTVEEPFYGKTEREIHDEGMIIGIFSDLLEDKESV